MTKNKFLTLIIHDKHVWGCPEGGCTDCYKFTHSSGKTTWNVCLTNGWPLAFVSMKVTSTALSKLRQAILVGPVGWQVLWMRWEVITPFDSTALTAFIKELSYLRFHLILITSMWHRQHRWWSHHCTEERTEDSSGWGIAVGHRAGMSTWDFSQILRANSALLHFAQVSSNQDLPPWVMSSW